MSLNLIAIDNGILKFNKDNLETVLKQIPSDMEIIPVSIVGPFRSGKSLMMNLICDNLNNNSLSEITKREIVDNFPSSSGIDPVTKGIDIYEKPIIIKKNETHNIAIILLDTPGLFDTNTDQFTIITIFGLATLLSSYLIYNIDKRIQEDTLQNLALFTEYAKQADIKHKSINTILPIIDILVRDFQSLDGIMVDNLDEYCKNYLEQILRKRGNDDLDSTRNIILSYNIICNILPHPGLELTKKNTKIMSDIFTTDFRLFVNNYINNLKSKLDDCNTFSNSKYLFLVDKYVNIFTESKNKFPKAKLLIDAIDECNTRESKDIALELYLNEMEYLINKSYCQESTLYQFHDKSLTKSLLFLEENKFLEKQTDIYNTIKQSMIDEIQLKFDKLLLINKQRNPLNKFKKINPLYLAGGGLSVQALSSTCYSSSAVCTVGYSFSSLGLFAIIPLILYKFSENLVPKIFKEKEE